MNLSPRIMSAIDLREAIIDTGLEIDDLKEELFVHEQYSPTSHVFNVWVGTVEEWTAEWNAINNGIALAQKLFDTLAREHERRRLLKITRELAIESPNNMAMLEDYYLQVCLRQQNKARG